MTIYLTINLVISFNWNSAGCHWSQSSQYLPHLQFSIFPNAVKSLFVIQRRKMISEENVNWRDAYFKFALVSFMAEAPRRVAASANIWHCTTVQPVTTISIVVSYLCIRMVYHALFPCANIHFRFSYSPRFLLAFFVCGYSSGYFIVAEYQL